MLVLTEGDGLLADAGAARGAVGANAVGAFVPAIIGLLLWLLYPVLCAP